MNDRRDGYDYPARERFETQQDELDSYRRAADHLNSHHEEVPCLQHEFRIYRGPAGSHVVALLKEVRMPVVTILHTVLLAPDPTQRKVMETLVRNQSPHGQIPSLVP